MKYLMMLTLVGLAACANAFFEDNGDVRVGGKIYQLRTVNPPTGTFSAYRGRLIYDSVVEVKVGGQWYECIGGCRATVLRVLANKSTSLPTVPKSQSSPPVQLKLPLVRSGEGEGEGGY